MLGVMTFQDLPNDITERSLAADPVLAADVVDLFCPLDARIRGSLVLVTCDAEGRPVQPILIDDVPGEPSPAQARRGFGAFLDLIGGVGALLVAMCRPGTIITDGDRTWHQAAIETCRSAGIPLIGAFVAAPERVMRLPDPEPSVLSG